MKKFNKAIYLFANSSILNTENVKAFEKFSIQDTVNMNSLLYSNWIEILTSPSPPAELFDVYFMLDKRDEEFIQSKLLPGFSESSNIIITDYAEKMKFWNDLETKYFVNYPNNILIPYNSIVVTPDDIKKIFDLLLIEDTALAIGKSGSDKIVFLGFNKISEEIFSGFYYQLFSYQEYLVKISPKDFFIHVLEGFLTVSDLNDFKKLYIELSKKESFSYCSEKIHEKFNDLFIEYKELLNE